MWYIYMNEGRDVLIKVQGFVGQAKNTGKDKKYLHILKQAWKGSPKNIVKKDSGRNGEKLNSVPSQQKTGEHFKQQVSYWKSVGEARGRLVNVIKPSVMAN